MKYIFFIGFTFKKFKNTSRARIFLDDTLIDEIQLSKDIDLVENFNKFIPEQQWDLYKNMRFPKKEIFFDDNFTNNVKNTTDPDNKWELLGDSLEFVVPKKIFAYTIDLSNNPSNIWLDLSVHDNNFTNGFMTKSASFCLWYAGLIRADFIGPEKKLEEYFFKIKSKFFSCDKNKFTTPKGKVWYREPKHLLHAPVINKFLMEKNGEEKEFYPGTMMGGEVRIKFPLVKKHKTYMLRNGNDPMTGALCINPYVVWVQKQINRNI